MAVNKKAAAAILAITIAIPAEGLRQYAYRDPVGILTVCYGSTTQVETGKKYSLEECKSRLNADMIQAIETVDKCAPGLPKEVLAAFGDAVYNLGPIIACNTKLSTAARLLKANRIKEACEQLPRWDKAEVIPGSFVSLPGLKKRRAAERELCLSSLSSNG